MPSHGGQKLYFLVPFHAKNWAMQSIRWDLFLDLLNKTVADDDASDPHDFNQNDQNIRGTFELTSTIESHDNKMNVVFALSDVTGLLCSHILTKIDLLFYHLDPVSILDVLQILLKAWNLNYQDEFSASNSVILFWNWFSFKNSNK